MLGHLRKQESGCNANLLWPCSRWLKIAAVGKDFAKIDISLGYKGLEARKVARDDFCVGEIFIGEGKKHPYNQCLLGYRWKDKLCIVLSYSAI